MANTHRILRRKKSTIGCAIRHFSKFKQQKISIIEKRRNLTVTFLLAHSYVVSWNITKHAHIDYFSHEFSKSIPALSLLSHSNLLKEFFEICDFSMKL